MKLDDVESLLGLYVRKQDWDAALKLAEDPNGTFSEETRAKFDEALYLPYAEWLAVHDKFDEALEAYRKSGREDRAARMMQQLTFNAVVESRFKDASYYYWLLASETLRVAAKKDNLQKVGDILISGGVDNMEKYQYMLGQARTYQLMLQEISNLLDNKEQKDEQGTVIDLNTRGPKT